jgi:hypothetical protein
VTAPVVDEAQGSQTPEIPVIVAEIPGAQVVRIGTYYALVTEARFNRTSVLGKLLSAHVPADYVSLDRQSTRDHDMAFYGPE